MGQLTELQQVRKNRARKRAMKKFIVIVSFGILALILFFTWQGIKKLDIKTRFDDFMSSLGDGPGFPVEIAGREAISFFEIAGQPCVLNDSNLFIYNQKGKTTSNIQHGFNFPVAYSGNDRIVLFDIGGTKLQVNSRSKLIYEKDFDFPIIDATICYNGNVAVATQSDNFVSEVIVYNKSGKQIFKWCCSENIITNISLSKNSDLLAVSSINASEIGMKTIISLLNVNEEKEIKETEINGELPINISFNNSNIITLFTNKGFHTFSNSLRHTNTFNFDEKIPMIFSDFKEDYSCIVFKDTYKFNSYEIYYFDYKGNNIGNITHNSKINSVCINKQGIYFADNNKIFFYNFENSSQNDFDIPQVQRLLLNDNEIYYTTHKSVGKIPNNTK